MVKSTPDGYHTVTPYLTIAGAAEAINFYRQAFDATEVMRLPGPGGTVGHAEITIGDSKIMLADACPEITGTRSYGDSPVGILIYVDDADAVVRKAVAAGARVTRPIEDKFYGDRAGTLTDPYGHVWHVATHIEDVPMDELRRRMESLMSQAALKSS